MKQNSKKPEFLNLIQKTTAVITTSFGLLSNNSAQSFHQEPERSSSYFKYESLRNQNRKPKLVLRLNPHNPPVFRTF